MCLPKKETRLRFGWGTAVGRLARDLRILGRDFMRTGRIARLTAHPRVEGCE